MADVENIERKASDARRYLCTRCVRQMLIASWCLTLLGLVILIPIAFKCTQCNFDAVIISIVAVGSAWFGVTVGLCHQCGMCKIM